jgi:hypothetical protein
MRFHTISLKVMAFCHSCDAEKQCVRNAEGSGAGGLAEIEEFFEREFQKRGRISIHDDGDGRMSLLR